MDGTEIIQEIARIRYLVPRAAPVTPIGMAMRLLDELERRITKASTVTLRTVTLRTETSSASRDAECPICAARKESAAARAKTHRKAKKGKGA